MSTEKEARCSRCDEVVGVVVTGDGRATIRLSTSSHGDTLPITCPRALPRPTPTEPTETASPEESR